MEGFAGSRKQPRAVACLRQISVVYYCMTKALTTGMFRQYSSYLAKLVLEEVCEMHELVRNAAIIDLRKKTLADKLNSAKHRLFMSEPYRFP